MKTTRITSTSSGRCTQHWCNKAQHNKTSTVHCAPTKYSKPTSVFSDKCLIRRHMKRVRQTHTFRATRHLSRHRNNAGNRAVQTTPIKSLCTFMNTLFSQKVNRERKQNPRDTHPESIDISRNRGNMRRNPK